uniref:Uncharacterized protein n=1 Tax=Cucumis sativus TaxID=3659 RepID=A0A0A0LVG6_CUCSA
MLMVSPSCSWSFSRASFPCSSIESLSSPPLLNINSSVLFFFSFASLPDFLRTSLSNILLFCFLRIPRPFSHTSRFPPSRRRFSSSFPLGVTSVSISGSTS